MASKTSQIICCILSIVCVVAFVSPSTAQFRLLNRVPINSMNVKVIDQNGKPIRGAEVEASNGRKNTTGKDGVAKIRFGSVGVFTVSVYADNYMPSNFVITMPVDRGKTITRRLTGEVDLAGVNLTGAYLASVNIYPLIFNYMFSSYGFSPQVESYKEGQGTTWKITSGDDDDVFIMSKAYLKKLDNGNQWWQIKLTEQGSDSTSYVAEMLFSKDQSELLRYRDKIGNGNAEEKPVSKGWYTQPVALTKESMEGAVKEKDVSVKVPKGTFKADMLQFGVAPDTYLDIWRAKDSSIPGGVLKYQVKDDDGTVYISALKDYSDHAHTVLNSY